MDGIVRVDLLLNVRIVITYGILLRRRIVSGWQVLLVSYLSSFAIIN